jgi:DNA-binding transcriptional ArsR family regulator
MQSKQLEDEQSLERAYQKLRIYSALDHRIRINAIFLVADNPGVSFNELVRMTKVPATKLAYHLGLLKSEDLVKFTYERRGKATSRYFITELGKTMVRELRSETRKL